MADTELCADEKERKSVTQALPLTNTELCADGKERKNVTRALTLTLKVTDTEQRADGRETNSSPFVTQRSAANLKT